ncbi:MAG: hypothetical protein AAB510_03065 [Patescibacteria group bacterium]
MKNIIKSLKKSYILLVVAMIFGIVLSPFVSTNVASAEYATAKCTSATLNGDIVVNGAVTSVWFEWGEGDSLSNTTAKQTFASDSTFSRSIGGLTEDTEYSFRAMASNKNGTSVGEILTFKTNKCTQPVPKCEDPSATNYKGTLPCKYPAPKCEDHNATNYGGSLPCKYPAPKCEDSAALNYGGTLPCKYAPKCTDYSALNYGGSLPCKYPAPTCQDHDATNYGGSLPCKYPPQVCKDSSATNYGGTLPCKYPKPTCQDHDALNYGGSLPCKYAPKTCQDSDATNYGGSLPCKYPKPTCQEHGAINYGGSLPCKHPAPKCADHDAINYGGALPCKYKKVVPMPTVILSAENDEIPFGGKTVLNWVSENATSCTATGGMNGWSGAKNLTGTFKTGTFTSSKTYNITCKNTAGTATDSVMIEVGTQSIEDPIVDIYADDSNLENGGSTNIRWNSENAISCTANGGSNGWNNSKPLTGIFFTGALNSTTTYNISCKNSVGKIAVGSVKITVDGKEEFFPSVTIYADESVVIIGKSTNIRWTSENATSCITNGGANNWTGNKGLAGIFNTGKLKGDVTYNITCKNAKGLSASDSVTVSIEHDLPTVLLNADVEEVVYDKATTLRWSSENATSCVATAGTNGWAGKKALSGNMSTGNLRSAKTYNITCTNNSGSTDATITINVKGKITVVTL